MNEQNHDAIVEVGGAVAHVRAISAQARQWIETHVTLEQARLWTGHTLEVAPHYIGDLIAGMLADGLKVSTVRGHAIEQRDQLSSVLFLTPPSQN
jgi:hypothetical protein